MMNYNEIQASPHLSNYIRCFWTISAKLDDLKGNKLLFPSRGYFDLDFNITGELIRRNNNKDTVCKEAYLCGINNDYIEVEVLSDVEIFGVRFCHSGAFFLFNIPLDEFTGLNINLLDITLNDRLSNKILESKNTKERITIIEDLMTKNIMNNKPNLRVHDSVQKMYNYSGNISSASLSKYLNLSERQFRRVFKTYVGLPPKALSRIIRFQSMLSAYRTKKTDVIWKTIEQCGYIDQSHICKDFKYFTTQSSKQFISNENDVVRYFNKI